MTADCIKWSSMCIIVRSGSCACLVDRLRDAIDVPARHAAFEP